MSLDLDDETRAELGWGTHEEREDGLRVNKAVIQPSRIAPGDIDGRSKRNWRHKTQQSCTRDVVADTTQLAPAGDNA